MGATRLRNSTSSIVLTTPMAQSHMMMSLQCFAQLLQRIPRRSAVLYSDLLMARVPRVFSKPRLLLLPFVPFDYASVTRVTVCPHFSSHGSCSIGTCSLACARRNLIDGWRLWNHSPPFFSSRCTFVGM